MPVSLKNTNYGESHAARRHITKVPTPPAPLGKHATPIAVPYTEPQTSAKAVPNAASLREAETAKQAESGKHPEEHWDTDAEQDASDRVDEDAAASKKHKNHKKKK